MSSVIVRTYKPGEEPALWNIYYGAIRHVCSLDYSPDQLTAWAPDDFDPQVWATSVQRLNPFVAELDSQLVGYTDLQQDGLIDHFFVHHQFQRRGVAGALMARVLEKAAARNMERLYSHVSKTAQPFYKRFGFTVVKQNEPVIRGVSLSNATMEKVLT